MNLIGEFKAVNTDFLLFLNDISVSRTFTLISSVHPDDRMLEVPEHPVLTGAGTVHDYFNTEYVVESIKLRKRTGIVSKYGKTNLLAAVIDALAYARSYKFDQKDIIEHITEMKDTDERIVFHAVDDNLGYSYEQFNGLFTFLSIKTTAVDITLYKVNFSLNLKNLKYTELSNNKARNIMVATMKKMTFDTLNQILDMSWYKKDGKLNKKYVSVKSQEEFELVIMTPLIKTIVKNGEKGTDVALDTETDGLNVYNLSKNNPDKNHCVAVPICWKINESYVIYTDMEHFSNVPNEWVASRLGELFENFSGERIVEYQEKVKNEIVTKTATIRRKWINLIGHNSLFDGRVFFDLGKKFYFNQNTLQMAFDIFPNSVRGSKKLKVLTRFFFGCETPELSDVLGKGNEDKYRYLEDDEVARIYGCADADFTLACFYRLRELMPDTMYYWYQKQDIPMDNILYQSEYWGMRTIEESVKELAEHTKQNIEILKKCMYEYVGTYIDYMEKRKSLEAMLQAGILSSDEFQKSVKNIILDPAAVYEFEFKPEQLRHVLYTIMKYPVKAYTEGKIKKPKIDKYAIDKLLEYKLEPDEHPVKLLQKDILVAGADRAEYEKLCADSRTLKKASSMVLLNANEFNSLRYPLALIIKKYSELYKEYTSYFKPIEETNMEGKIFKGYNMARIETRRIANPG